MAVGKYVYNIFLVLTHWGRVTHICVGKLTNIGSDNGLSPGRRQAIIWTNAGMFLIGTLGTNFSEFSIVIHTFSFNGMHLKMSSAKWRYFCLGLNVLILLTVEISSRYVDSCCWHKLLYAMHIWCMAVMAHPSSKAFSW